ncbi:MAG: hypothetical protein WCJ55_01970 [Chloroflexales bacterium]
MSAHLSVPHRRPSDTGRDRRRAATLRALRQAIPVWRLAPMQTHNHPQEAMMELMIGDPVQVWDDDGGRWRFGEVTALDDDQVEVTVLNGDHPLHPWQAETILVPRDPAFIQPLRSPTR